MQIHSLENAFRGMLPIVENLMKKTHEAEQLMKQRAFAEGLDTDMSKTEAEAEM